MSLRRFTWAAVTGLSLLASQLVWGGEPAPIGLPIATPIPTVQVDSAQKLAESIAANLEQAGTLKQYRVDISVRSGVVELTGTVTTQEQREEVLRLVQGVPGVHRVSDRMTLTNQVVRVARLQEEGPAPKVEGLGAPKQPMPQAQPEALDAPKSGGSTRGGSEGNGNMPAPQPIFSAAGAGYGALNPPSYPPYAWPTYAPYNNFSRVAHPEAYPYKSWPFIGPLYPYPKVPLGWRCVKLEWDDGYWWFGRVGCKHDWWKLRYW